MKPGLSSLWVGAAVGQAMLTLSADVSRLICRFYCRVVSLLFLCLGYGCWGAVLQIRTGVVDVITAVGSGIVKRSCASMVEMIKVKAKSWSCRKLTLLSSMWCPLLCLQGIHLRAGGGWLFQVTEFLLKDGRTDNRLAAAGWLTHCLLSDLCWGPISPQHAAQGRQGASIAQRWISLERPTRGKDLAQAH